MTELLLALALDKHSYVRHPPDSWSLSKNSSKFSRSKHFEKLRYGIYPFSFLSVILLDFVSFQAEYIFKHQS